MVTKVLNYIKTYWYVIAIVFCLMTLYLLKSFNDQRNRLANELIKTEYIDKNGTFHKVYEEEDFKALKKENRELYDSLKKYKKQISDILQFRYTKRYVTNKVSKTPISVNVVEVNKLDTIKVFEYQNGTTDSIKYNLQIASTVEPKWHKLDITVNDELTIVNKKGDNGINHLTIDSNNKGTITDVTVFKKKESKGFWKRFKAGPSATVGYDPINKRFGTAIGIGIMFDITK